MQGGLVLLFVASLFMSALGRGMPESEARALAFSALIATNIGLVLVNRSSRASVIAAFRRPNRAMWWVLGTTAMILGAIITIPPARHLFQFGPLHGDDFAVAVLTGFALLLALELGKGLLERLRQPQAM